MCHIKREQSGLGGFGGRLHTTVGGARGEKRGQERLKRLIPISVSPVFMRRRRRLTIRVNMLRVALRGKMNPWLWPSMTT
jgi:hypothetical protein